MIMNNNNDDGKEKKQQKLSMKGLTLTDAETARTIKISLCCRSLSAFYGA